MTLVERRALQARRQLTINSFLVASGWTLGAGAGGFALTVLAERLLGIGLPLGWMALGWLVLAVVAAGVWTLTRRPGAAEAATALDQAAGLRERLSSGLYCARSDDPFARAVVADAQRVGAGLSVGRHLPVRWPATLNYAGGAVAAALLTLLLPNWNLLAESPVEESKRQLAARAEVARAQWQAKLEEIKQTARDNPLLSDQVEKMEEMKTGPLDSPDDLRREAVKRLETLRESVERRQTEAKYESLLELKKMLGRLAREQQPDSQMNRLSDALSRGDFAEAKKALQEMQEKLAKTDDPQQAELSRELQQQLADLARKLEQLAENKKTEEALKAEGLRPEDIERLLAQLEKKDLSEIRKQLEQMGMNQVKAEQLAGQLAKMQASRDMAQRMAKSLARCAGQMQGPGGAGVPEGMDEAMDQLSELEQLEQQMAEMNSTLADLSRQMEEARQGCSACNGTGMRDGRPCGNCGGSGMRGSGMGGRLGQGQGGLAPEQETGVAFKRERTPVQTTRGRIIGKMLVEGEQFKGEVSPEYRDLVMSAQREATEALENEQVPQQYKKTIKEYFTRQGSGAASETNPGSDASRPPDRPAP